MLVVDGHLDLAMNALYLNRDLRLSAHELRRREAHIPHKHSGLGRATTAFPDMRKGDVGLSVVTVLGRVRPEGTSYIDFKTAEIAYAHSQGQLAIYREFERQGDLRMIASVAELDSWLADWRQNPDATPLGAILSMEGADPVVDPDQLHLWWQDGLRIISLVHYGKGPYAHGTATEGPLTDAGRRMLDEIRKVGMILDVTHLCDLSFWEAIERFDGPLVATHHNCRTLVPNDRQLADEQIKALIARDAIISAAFDAWMLQPGWIIGTTTPEKVTIDTVVDHIDHVCQLAGNSRHAAIGTDLDGGYGTEQTPRDLDTIADLQGIPDLLARRGYGNDDIAAIMHGNWLRVLRAALPAT